jgi:hypothetical protein
MGIESQLADTLGGPGFAGNGSNAFSYGGPTDTPPALASAQNVPTALDPNAAPASGLAQDAGLPALAQNVGTSAPDPSNPSSPNASSSTSTVSDVPPSSSQGTWQGPLDANVQASVNTLNSNAEDTYKSTHNCSYAVATAINAGLPIPYKPLTVIPDPQTGGIGAASKGPANGGRMGPILESRGYVPVASTGYVPQPGDVAVIQQQNGGRGHVTMWNGNQWVSDYQQGQGNTNPSPYANPAVTTTYYRSQYEQ